MSKVRLLSILILICITFAVLSAKAFAQAQTTVEISPRLEQNFSIHWLYTPKDIAGGEKPALNDGGFEHVSVPHANIITPGETMDPDVFRFISWYRKLSGSKIPGKANSSPSTFKE